MTGTFGGYTPDDLIHAEMFNFDTFTWRPVTPIPARQQASYVQLHNPG